MKATDLRHVRQARNMIPVSGRSVGYGALLLHA